MDGLQTTESRPFSAGFGPVLLLLLASYFVAALGGDTPWGRPLVLALLATTCFLALRAAPLRPPHFRAASWGLLVVAVVAVTIALVGRAETATLVGSLLGALLVIVAPVAIARRLVRHPDVTVDSFYGAVCIYLMLAMFFASIYAFLGAALDQPFFVQVDEARNVDYLYFSFVTITTTGYGDLTARADVGRMVAVTEAISGQLYLISVVAIVVQGLAERRRAGKRGDD
jgi:hypothetical protein